MLIGLREVVYSYGSHPVLRGVDLQVAAGETVALLGPSGAGKSTLLGCMAGLRVPDSGKVTLDGRDLRGLSRDQLAELRLRTFGFVLQEGGLLDELDLLENVELPLRLADVRPGPARTRARDVLSRLGIDTDTMRRRPGQVSGGQKQRVAVARALVNRPRVVFADEPTGALDEAASRTVVDLLLEAVDDAGSALVMVTHNPALADRLDRQVHVRDGRVTHSSP